MDMMPAASHPVKRRLQLTAITYLLCILMGLSLPADMQGYYLSGEMGLGEYALDLLFCMGFVELSIFYSKLIIRRLVPADTLRQMALPCSLLLFLLNNATALGISWLFSALWEGADDSAMLLQNLYIHSTLAAFITGVYTNSVFLDSYLEASHERKRLEIIALQTQLRALKQQLNPHFMFNNFSILSELIHENRRLACRFLDELSKVYRYAVRNFDRDMVPVHEKMRFLDSYLYLLSIRYEKAIALDIDPALKQCDGCIPPASLQLLVENAIKHNRASEEEPLHIRLQLREAGISVSNNLQPIAHPPAYTGVGLRNITERYSLLCRQAPAIHSDDSTYTVTLPLLPGHEYLNN